MSEHPTEKEHLREDEEAQQHPEGNVPQRIEDANVGLVIDDGQPAGEVNHEETLKD